MSIATGTNAATPGQATARPAPGAAPTSQPATRAAASTEAEVALALSAAIQNASRIGELLDVLRAARLWLPLPGDGTTSVSGADVTLPLVSYLGSDFVPAYTSAELLHQAAGPSGPDSVRPHAVVRACDLARLLPPAVGIALNPGASQSVPLYPQGVSYLAAGASGNALDHVTVSPLPVRPDGLLADIAAGFMQIAPVREASAAWLSVQFAGDGLLIAVTLDDPRDGAVRDRVAGMIERAAWQASPQDASFPIDVSFPGQVPLDDLDTRVSTVGTPFYRREAAALPGSAAAPR